VSDALREELSRLLRTTQAEERVPSLVAAVFRGPEIVWSDAVGLANADAGEAATPDHQYRIGSITKTLTAAAVMQLREAGLVDLDDRLSDHVPESPHGPTLRRMLSHLSGLQREFAGRVWESLELPERDAFLASLGETESVLPQSAAWHYSNLAFALLGEVVERRSGIPYRRYLEERVLGPAGLTRTTWEGAPPLARGYLVDPYSDRLTAERSDLDLRGTAAAGGLWSTVADLCRWGAFLCEPDEAVLAPSAVEEMHTVQAMLDPVGWTSAWGLGLSLLRKGDRILAGHNGGMPGHVSFLTYSRPEKVGSAIVYGTSAPTSKALALALDLTVRAAEAFPAEPDDPWRPTMEDLPAHVAGMLGRWWSEGYELVFSWRDGHLEAFHTAAPAYRSKAVFREEASDRFRIVEGFERGELLEVVRDESGGPTMLYLASYPLTREPRAFV
jgi:CubicO group peptidase (beta-lactamase class C family)